MTTPPTTLHDRLGAELDRRLTVARAATPGPWSADPTGTVCADADLVSDFKGGELLPIEGPSEVAECYREERSGERAANAAHIALHDPADAIRRYVGELEVLERHNGYAIPAGHGHYSGRPNCNVCNGMEWPCREIRSLASRLGVNVDGEWIRD